MRYRHFLLLSALALALCGPASGQTFDIDTQVQGTSRIVALENGGFVTVWARPTSPFPTGTWQIANRAVLVDDIGELNILGAPVNEPAFDAAASGNTVLVVWQDLIAGSLKGQVLDASGQPTGNAFDIAGIGAAPSSIAAAGGDEGFAVVWSLAGVLYARFLDRSGNPTSGVIAGPSPLTGNGTSVGVGIATVAMKGDSTMLLYAVDTIQLGARLFSDLYSQRIFSDGRFGPERLRGTQPGPTGYELDLAPYPDGGFVAAWSDRRFGTTSDVTFQRLDADGVLVTDYLAADRRPITGDRTMPRVAADRNGAIALSWLAPFESQTRFATRTFDPQGHPLGTPQVTSGDFLFTAGGDLDFLPSGEWVRSEFRRQEAPILLPDGTDSGLFAVQESLPCRPDGHTLCLREGRFAVQVLRNGQASPVQVLTSDTGGFWFFSEDNLEVLVKVLDGRPVNGHFWVLFGSLSNLAYVVEVTDTATGEMRRYGNPDGMLASQAHTEAFVDDGSPLTETSPVVGAPDGNCPPGAPEVLCVTEGRFEISAEWIDPRSGRTGSGTGRLISDNSGAFWFFGPENIELIVKVLDGRTSNGHFWVFIGSLTDVEVNLRVDDTVTGETWTHRKPPFVLESYADTEALPAATQD
ncbi:MAG: hypothetical protein AAF604_02145 [Acidobacteriota bacterium]